MKLRIFSDGRIEPEKPEPGKAKSMVPHGCSDKELKELRKAWAEQGAPTTNRATRRRSQQAGDKARRAKARKQQ